MTKFLLLYRSPVSAADQMAGSTPESAQAGMDAWMAWAGKAGSAIVDMGSPVSPVQSVGAERASGDFIGGFSLWVDERGHLNHTYQFLGVETYKQTSIEPIPTGDVLVKMLFDIDEPKPGSGGDVTLWANGKQIGEGRLDHTCSMLFTTYAGMDMGRDNGGVVDDAYEDKAPYAFTGTLRNVVFDLKPMALEAEQALHEAASTAGVASGAGG